MGKGLITQGDSKLQNIFLKDGNRPYCEDWNHIDTVGIERWWATCNRKSTNMPSWNKFSWTIWNFVCRQFCHVRNWCRRKPDPQAKEWNRAQSLSYIQQQLVKMLCIITACINYWLFQSMTLERIDLRWWDQQLACWWLVTLLNSLHPCA